MPLSDNTPIPLKIIFILTRYFYDLLMVIERTVRLDCPPTNIHQFNYTVKNGSDMIHQTIKEVNKFFKKVKSHNLIM